MNRSAILAHRGWFLEDREKNTKVAIARALDNGFGLETDIRDLNGRIVISHDPPLEQAQLPDLRWLLERIAHSSIHARIALNVKADGLANVIADLIEMAGVNSDQIYVFDMSIPDSLAYLNSTIPAYVRISEFEKEPSFVDRAMGVWVDDFTGTCPQIERAAELLGRGIRTALVSAELHRRDHRPLWNAIVSAGLHRHPLFELCTDYPAEAASLFCES